MTLSFHVYWSLTAQHQYNCFLAPVIFTVKMVHPWIRLDAALQFKLTRGSGRPVVCNEGPIVYLKSLGLFARAPMGAVPKGELLPSAPRRGGGKRIT